MAALLALVSSLLWGAADFAGGLASRRLPALVVVAGSQAAGLVGIAVVVLVVREWADPSGWVGWSIVAGLSGSGGLVLFYRALAIGTMGVVSPLAALGVVVPVVAGLVAGDRPSVLQVAGMVVAVGGAVLASGPELTGSALSGSRGRSSVVMAVASGGLFGVCLLGIARGAASSSLLTLLGMRTASVVVLASILVLHRGSRQGVVLRPRDLPMVVAVGWADISANLLFALASTMGLVSIVAVLGALYPVATVLLARGLLAERLVRVQVAGVGATLAGVALLSLG